MPTLNVSMTDAESYFANRLYSDTWDSSSSTDRRKALEWATRLIDGAYTFNEYAYIKDENAAIVWDSNVIAAVCEQAVWCLKADPTEYPELLTMGISNANAGASVTFDKSFITPIICTAAKVLIGTLGTLNNENGVVKSMFLGG